MMTFCQSRPFTSRRSLLPLLGVVLLAGRTMLVQTVKDSNPSCQVWARGGECSNNPGYMLNMCRKSCGRDQAKDPRCVDQNKNCRTLARGGACQHNTSEMLVQCPESCNVCGAGDPCLPNMSDAGAFPGPTALHDRFKFIVSDPSMQEFRPHALSEEPWIVGFENFLTDAEVAQVQSSVKDGWQRSTAGGLVGEDSALAARTSEQIWCNTLACMKSPGMKLLLERVENITNVSRTRYEDTQFLRYTEGQRYNAHVDFIDGQGPQACGPRVVTFFVYLSDSPEAGTNFPIRGVTVPARKGTAALWQNVKSDNYFEVERRSNHEGMPPTSGSTKYAANIWIHQYDFRSYNQKHCLLAGRLLKHHEGVLANKDAAKTDKDEL